MKRRRFSWKTLRVIVQVFAFLLVGAYFLGLVYPLEVSWRPDLLFQLDPLTHLYLLLSGNGIPHWIWALVALVLLFAVSRIFCAVRPAPTLRSAGQLRSVLADHPARTDTAGQPAALGS